MSPLTAWNNFYVIVGSSAGALTGLTFVVITLVVGRQQRQNASWGINAFTTPTVVHFGFVIVLSAILSAPWPAFWQAALVLGLCGLGGMAYCSIVVRRLRRRLNYQPEGEDWLWYAIVPLVAYTALVVLAIMLPGNPTPALFGIGAVMLVLLFLSIHNAWDIVTYVAIDLMNPQNERAEREEREEHAERETSGTRQE
jgi:hypothetical protein